jgi:hypothetical protein
MIYNQRKIIYGYMDFGPIQIPPLPPRIVMTDRGTGELLWLTYIGTDPEFAVILTDEWTNGPDITFYDEFDGPYLGNGRARLYAENGALDAEDVLDYPYINQAPVYIRRDNNPPFLRIEVPPGWDAGEPIVVYPTYPGQPDGPSFVQPSIGHMVLPSFIL